MYLLPTPKILELKDGMLPLGNRPLSDFLTKKLSPRLAQKESYRITVNADGILIEGADEAGLYYGTVTLSLLSRNYKGFLPYLYLYDEPVYGYRGFMIDACRHFFTVAEIKKMIDAAALFKFNRFHFHLSDDQGFRAQIESWPLLTTVASVRHGSHFGRGENDDADYRHFYTKEELREIVAYCHERHIAVIPELDVPGHTTAILSAYPALSCKGVPIEAKTSAGIFPDILCAGNPDTMRMLTDVISELCEIFTDPYFHLGGDEAPKVRWDNCEKCKAKKAELGLSNMDELQSHLLNELAAFLKAKGKKAFCWNDALKGQNLSGDNLTVSYWMERNKNTENWANAGNKVVVETFQPYYVDYPLGMHTLGAVYRYRPEHFGKLTEIGKNNIIGIESPIWTEYVTSFRRMSALCFPRWLAVAETAWNGTAHKDYAKFLDNTRFFSEILYEMGHFPAPREEWDLLPHKRLSQIAGFFRNSLTRDILSQPARNKKDR